LFAPDVRIKIQAIMFMISVARRTSQSWKRRVMSGRKGTGISSDIEWNMRGKTKREDISKCGTERTGRLARRKVVASM
jgi:hypothetical protein